MSNTAVYAPARALFSFFRIFLIGVFLASPAFAQDERDIAYTYDALGRLETVTYVGLSADGSDIKYTYTYDAAGNRKVVTVEGSALAAAYLEDAHGIEGGVLSIPVFLSGDAKGIVSFDWAVIAGENQVEVASRNGAFSMDTTGLMGQVATIDLDLVDDTTKESVQQFTIQITAPDNVLIDPANDTAIGFVQDNDTTYFTMTDQVVIEGGLMEYTVSKVTPAGALSETITVTFSTQDLTAAIGADYEEVAPLTQVFAPTDTSKTVSVNTLADIASELDETFALKADWTAESIYVGSYGALGTIQDSGGFLPSVFTVSNGSGTEGLIGALTVSRPSPGERPYDVALSVVGGTAALGDYTMVTPASLSFVAGELSKTVDFTLTADQLVEADETLVLQAAWSDAENGAQVASGTLTILDEGGPSTFTVSSGSGTEGLGSSLVVSRPSPADRAYSVAFSAVAGGTADVADYTITTPLPLSFAVGELSKTVSFDLTEDQTVELIETLSVQASWSDAENGAQVANGTLTILDDGVQQNRAPVAVADSATVVMPVIAVIGLPGGDIITDSYDPAGGGTPLYNGTAVINVVTNDTDEDGDNLTLTAVSVASGSYVPLGGPRIAGNLKSVEIDFDECGIYTFDYTVKDPSGLTSSSTLTITTSAEGGNTYCVAAGTNTAPGGGDPAPMISIGTPANATEGGNLVYTVSRSGDTRDQITVDWVVSGGTATEVTDYVLPAYSRVILPAGASSRTITITTVQDADIVEPDETITLQIVSVSSSASIGTASATGTIIDDDVAGNKSPLPQPDYINVTMVDLGINDSYFGDVNYNVLTNDTDPDGDVMTAVNGLVLMEGYGGAHGLTISPAGQVTGGVTQCGRYRFQYDVRDSNGSTSSSFLDITSSQIAGCPVATAPQDEPFPVVTIAAAASTAEGGSLSFPVTLSTNYADPVRISWSVTAGASDVDTASGLLNFNPGDALTKNISVPTTDDILVEGNETITVTLDATQVNAELGTPISAAGTITDNDQHSSFAVTADTVTEGGSITYTITKTGVAAQSYSVTYSTALGSAEAADIVGALPSGTLTFGAAEYTKTVTILTEDDSDWEQQESVVMTLSAPTNGATITTASASGGIGNNDGEPIINAFNNGKQEGSGSSTLTMQIFLQGGTQVPVTLTYQTTAGTATPSVDYVEIPPTTVTIQPGIFSHYFDVTILGDSIVEADEYFNVVVSNPVNALILSSGVKANGDGTNGTGNINNDDVAYTYSWVTGSYSYSGSCSSSGQSGTRSVVCKRNQDNATVSDSYCSGGKPSSSTTRSCTMNYSYGSWGPWQGACGGTQTAYRSVTCTWSPAGNSCGSSTESKTQTCNIKTYSNSSTTWGNCSSGGTRTGSYVRTCTWSPSGNSCGSETIATSGTCTPPVTYTYAWNTGSWSGWSCVGFGDLEERTRGVSCLRSPDGTTVSDSSCGGGKPSTEEARSNSFACGGGF